MKSISVINYKGGVGKTTLTANLAAEMAYRGKRVLVIDLDPQANLTFSFMSADEWEKKYSKDKTIKSWFDAIIDGAPPVPSFSDFIVSKRKVDIICSHLGLIDVDIELAAFLTGNTERQQRNNFVRTYSYIRKELNRFQESYDIVLFDCPPNFSIVTRNAVVASDYYIIPAKMDYLSTLGINTLRNHINQLTKDYNGKVMDEESKINPLCLGVIATMIQIRSGAPISANNQFIQQLQRENIQLFDTMIRENKTLYSDAPQIGVPVVLQSRAGSTYQTVVSELEQLTTELLSKAGAQ